MRNTQNNKSSRGFTLVEILIVGGIGGMIMAVVIIGISHAQRDRRDSIRRQAVASFIAAVQQAAVSNNTVHPACLSTTPTPCPAPAWTPPPGITISTIGFGSPTLNGNLHWDTTGEDCTFSGYWANQDGRVEIKLESGAVYCESY